MAGVNDALRDRAIRHALAISGYGATEARDAVLLLNETDADLCAKIAGRLAAIEERGAGLSPKVTARLEKLLDEVRAINSAAYDRLHEQLVDNLQEFSDAEARYHRDSLIRALPVGLPDLGMTIPSPVTLRSIVTEEPITGTLLSKWVEDLDTGRVDAISRAIRVGMAQGEGTDDIVRRIRGSKALGYRDGVLNKSRESVVSLVRTAVNHVSNHASQATWRENSRVVGGWQFLATLDTRTTPVCASRDGQTFPIGEGPIPPLHIRCRSISVAVTKSWRELGIDADDVPAPARASMDGQVANGTTFATWLRGKDEAAQNKVLGKARADLFRSGKLDLQDLLKGDQLLTLDQLKKAHKDILG